MIKRNNFLEGMICGIAFILCVNVLVTFVIPMYSKNEVKLGADEKLNKIYEIIDTFYVEDYKKEDIEDGMFLGMVYGLGDKYSTYMDKETFKGFMDQTEGTYVGIGAVVGNTDDGRVEIVSPYDGSPAAKAGLLPKDVITHVGGLDITNAGLENVTNMIKGKDGTLVNITIYRASESRTFDVEITRETVVMQTVTYKMLQDNIGYIRLSGFERVTYDQFMQAVDAIKAEGATSLILDVRNNPGGLLDVVADICDVLVPEGTIVYTEDKNGNQKFLKSDANYLNIPMVLLINGNSASASEVLAGAIKDYEVGVLVGETTFGKGLVQNIYPLEDGSAVKVTIARYYSPKGVCIHGTGIEPDYVEPMDSLLSATVSNLTYEQDIQLQKAVEVIQQLK